MGAHESWNAIHFAAHTQPFAMVDATGASSCERDPTHSKPFNRLLSGTQKQQGFAR